MPSHLDLGAEPPRDFNCALSPKDKLGGTPATRKASVIKEIENLCESHNLRDI